jgi:hypothetical protein
LGVQHHGIGIAEPWRGVIARPEFQTARNFPTGIWHDIRSGRLRTIFYIFDEIQ